MKNETTSDKEILKNEVELETHDELISDCCGAHPKGNGDCDTSDYGICPECGEHCEYIYI